MSALDDCKDDARQMLALAVLSGDAFLITACDEYGRCLNDGDLQAAFNVNQQILEYTRDKLRAAREQLEGGPDEAQA